MTNNNDSQSNPTIVLHQASTLTLLFQEAASAGYQWSTPEQEGLWIRRLPIKDEQKNANDTSKTPIGGAIAAKFSIMAEWAGDYEVTFTHQRPWERPNDTAETITYRIHVPQT